MKIKKPWLVIIGPTLVILIIIFAPRQTTVIQTDCKFIEAQPCINCGEMNYIYKALTPSKDTILFYSAKGINYEGTDRITVQTIEYKFNWE